jgi:LacI family transcriptional regulator
MTVTITRVAEEAGVSVATVSRVLNGKGPVSEATRRRILEVAARLRYVPHGAARSLITRQTDTIGVFLPDIHGEFFSELLRGIDLASRNSGYHLLVSGSHSNRAEMGALIAATRGRVDGLIVMSPDINPQTLSANLPEGLPTVVLNSRVTGPGFDSIRIDNHGGALVMTRHLLDLGHRRIVFIKGPARNHEARERLRGYRDAIEGAAGRGTAAVELDGDFTEEGGFRAGTPFMALRPRPTAVFAGNDSMAIGMRSFLRGVGLRIPDDLSLVGFDDIPMARFVSPPLTSVQVPIAQLGTRAVERLLDAITDKGGHQCRHEILATTLVVRRSATAPTRTRR